MSIDQPARSGERVVTWMYVGIVALAGVFGFVIGTISPADLEPVLFFVVPLPPTPLGVALFGMITVGTLLGALLLLVAYVSTVTGVDHTNGAETDREQ